MPNSARQVELHQLEMTLPALVPEAISIGGVAIEVRDEPIAIGGIPPMLAHVPKRPELAPHMVEHGVEHHTDAVGMELCDHRSEIVVRTKAAVDRREVARVVAVRRGLENRVQEHCANTEFLKIARPAGHAPDARNADAIVLARRTAESERVNLVERALICPHVRTPYNRLMGYGGRISPYAVGNHGGERLRPATRTA